MKNPKRWLPTLICFAVGTLIALAVLITGSFWKVKAPDIYRLLSDACIVSGVMVGGVGALVFASNSGVFDMLAYGIQHIFDLFRPNGRSERYRDFYEYKQSKGDRHRPVAFMLAVGLVFLALSGIFSTVWSKMQ